MLLHLRKRMCSFRNVRRSQAKSSSKYVAFMRGVPTCADKTLWFYKVMNKG